MLASLAIIFVGLAGRAAVDKLLALRSGPELVGLWAQLQSVADLVGGIALAGIGPGLTVLVAQASALHRQRNLLRSALLLGFGIALPAMLLVLLWAPGLSKWLTGGALPSGLLALAAITGWVAIGSGLLGAYWLGHRRQDRMLLLALATTLPVVATALWTDTGALLQNLVIVQCAAALAISVALLGTMMKRPGAHNADPGLAHDSRQLARYLPVGLAIGILSPASVLLSRGIVSDVLSWNDAGLMQALWRSSEWITGIAAGVLSLQFLPRLSKAHGSGRFAGELVRAGAVVIIPSALLLLLLFLNQKEVLSTLYDARFAISDRTAALFLLGDWVRVGSWVFLYVLFAMRRTVSIVVGEFFSLPLFAGLLYVFSDGLTLERAGLLYLLTYLCYLAFNAAAALRRPRG